MAQISNYPISKDIAERIFDVFVKSIISVKGKQETEDFIADLFTPTEKIMLAKRVAIAFLLLRKYEYREISKVLRVSLPTISSVSFSLKYGKGSYQKILSKIAVQENIEELLGKSIENILSVPASISKGGATWRYLRDETRKNNIKKHKAF